MLEVRRFVRVAGLALAGTVSVLLAVLLAERVVRPGVISEVQTSMLLGLVLLFVLPAMTYFAARQDDRSAAADAVARRLARRRRPALARAAACPHEALEPAHPPAAAWTASGSHDADPEDSQEERGRSIRHGAHGRSPIAHAHRGPGKPPAVHADYCRLTGITT
jgi:hypothetical protein